MVTTNEKHYRHIDGLTLESHLQQRLRGNSGATVHQSRRKFYRLKKKFFRTLDHQKGPVLFHQSVKERWDTDPKYRNKARNLKDYLSENGWPDNLEV